MKMPNGGHNPAYNVQFCTDTASQVIVGVDLLQAGTDHGQLTPMLAQIEKRYRRTPDEYLVDGGASPTSPSQEPPPGRWGHAQLVSLGCQFGAPGLVRIDDRHAGTRLVGFERIRQAHSLFWL